ncbi:hypothetical protein [Bacillus sp. B-jedd]|uniref:hypothetical protein n=1 Tax=Bacillus sp. B-jedd TaxID=1476857 RepID=UPI00051564DC|nr:hypothetical protein [Bacillus sp. B-jedd]CEG26345.1 hypothetical protein BN1002_01190 [Bacillus sp. B-jedd]
MEFIKSLGIFTVGSVTIMTALGFIARSIIVHWLASKANEYKSVLDKNLELHKSELQKEAEIFKAVLQKEANEHQIKYNRLHDERAVPIRDLYKKIIRMEDTMKNLFDITRRLKIPQ